MARLFVAFLVVAVVAGVLPGVATPLPVRAATTNVGYRDHSYSGTSAPTAEKPQSKLWYNDGRWWGSLYNSAVRKFQIYRLDWATQTWTDTGTVIDERDNSKQDVLWDGVHLYVASAGPSPSTSGDSARIWRYSYNTTTKAYSLDTGFPVTISTGGMLAVVIDKDTTGMLWATYTQGTNVYVTHTTTNDATWVAPYVLPHAGASSILSQDISAVVSYRGKIGVMWSNQNTWTFYFASHTDGAPDNIWNVVSAHSGSEQSDNHINLKSLESDASGQVFAAVKTSLNAPDAPLVILLRLKVDNSWTWHTFGRVADQHTRAIVAIDNTNRQLYMFATAPCCSGGTIYYKQTGLDNISFPSGLGTPFIQSSTDTEINNPTTTKQPLNGDTGLVVLAGDDGTHTYLHNAFTFGPPDTTPPDTTIDSGPTGTVDSGDATFTFSSSEAGSSFGCRLDGTPFAPCSSPQVYSGLANGSHTFEVRAIDLAGNTDLTPASRTWTVQATTTAFNPEADATVLSTQSTRNFGTTTTLTVDSSPAEDAYLRFPVTGLAGPVTNAKLRVFAFSSTTNGPAAFRTSNTWAETGITWANKPARIGSALDDRNGIASNTWVEYNVTPAVTGNGTYSFVLGGTSSDGVDFRSREFTSNRPQLVVTTASADTTPPETTINSGPSGIVGASSATFAFSADEPGTFECSIDSSPFAACTSPKAYTGLTDGAHSFSVRAIDSAGNMDLTPAGRTWTVDTTAPAAPSITSPADGTTTASTSVALSGTAEAGSSVEAFDGTTSKGTATADAAGAWTITASSLGDGSHSFTAKASDGVGNTSAASGTVTVTVDTTAPQTAIDSGPSGVTNSTTASFEFSSSEAGSTFACSLDGAAFAECSSPQSYSDLAAGDHTFAVRATDSLGNTDSSPATGSWTIDLTAPTVSSVAPADGSVGVSPAAHVRATFSEAMNAASIDGTTFVLEQSLTEAPVAATVTYDAATRTATLTADEELLPATSYTATVVGGAAGVADAAGNRLTADHSWSFTTGAPDTLAPETTIESGPTGTVTSRSASFEFSSSEPDSTFTCRLDEGAFSACSSPKSYSDLADGEHTFEVRATDAADNTDASPASRTWSIDATAPQTTIDSGPTGSVDETSATFTFSANESGSTFECSLDDGPFAACTSPEAYTALSDGAHKFEVRASDALGNTDASPAARSWTVDTAAPQTTIDSGPTGTVNSDTASFTFSASEAGSTFACSLDGAAFATCSSPKSYSGLSAGAHEFQVRASDDAGNTDASPATRNWTVEPTLFSDGFESGDFSAWTIVNTGGDGTATVQSATVKTGGQAGRLTATATTGSYATVRKTFSASHTDITVVGDFRVTTPEGSSSAHVPFFRLFDVSNNRLVAVYRQNVSGRIRVGHSGNGFDTSATLALNTWANVEVRVITAGTSSTIQIRVNGTQVYQTTTASLGTAGIRTLQIGNDTRSQPMTIFVDNVEARI